MTAKYRYDELTWPEMREAIARGPVVLLPFGTIEDHGPHLPINTDNVIVEAICLEAAGRAPGEMLVMPLLAYGLAILGAMVGGVFDHFYFNLTFIHIAALYWMTMGLGMVAVLLACLGAYFVRPINEHVANT